jgi:transcriptional regulator with XRE-family HTH domain
MLFLASQQNFTKKQNFVDFNATSCYHCFEVIAVEKEVFIYGMGQRIKQRREELGMTQQELAELVGYKSRSSINKIELGKNDIVQSTIQKIADALQTTPSYLMGWEARLLEIASEESKSGRTAAKEDMYRLFGTEHSAAALRLIDDKVAFLYYKALDRNAAPALADIVSAVDDMSPDDLENIRLLVRAYLKADEPIKDIVDTALRPYREEESLDAQLG